MEFGWKKKENDVGGSSLDAFLGTCGFACHISGHDELGIRGYRNQKSGKCRLHHILWRPILYSILSGHEVGGDGAKADENCKKDGAEGCGVG